MFSSTEESTSSPSVGDILGSPKSLLGVEIDWVGEPLMTSTPSKKRRRHILFETNPALYSIQELQDQSKDKDILTIKTGGQPLIFHRIKHCLPFSLGPELLQLSQRLSKDTTALNSTTLSRQSATYITSHGVCKTIRDVLRSKLQDCFFSLNIDEATNNAGNKFLNVIVQYYDEEGEEVKTQLLGTREINLANAENITPAVGDILNQMKLSWEQVVSVTMDNCNVMRGKKDGLEPKIRRHNKHLLDVAYAGFLNPEKIPACSATKLASVDFKREHQFNDRNLAVDKIPACSATKLVCVDFKREHQFNDEYLAVGKFCRLIFQIVLRIKNVIVQYYDEEGEEVKTQLLGTREINLANAENITPAVGDILNQMKLSWEQVVSVTMDNCNVMRGKKDGVNQDKKTQ
ncbi:hypothetical protein EGW08_008045 [Elysia chlorotica]|uniref:Uncharacterized protein n=1 Tax=Elysia chlorotica TaxID=188477 RepID=A0A433TRI2_ELYCH|nr:hypothetical protein EGW08_008045 [Elysia chlorotica]